MRKTLILLMIAFLGTLGCSKNDDGPKAVDKTGNLKAPGQSAHDILSDLKFKNIKIEIAHVAGYAPSAEAIAQLVEILEQRAHKNNIGIVYNELPSPQKEELTILEISKLETQHRTVYNEGDTLGLYIYFTDAASDSDKPEEDLVTLGSVYRNTSMVIYEATIRDFAARSIQVSEQQLETATLSHEAGHLFGLVNLGTPSINPHEDSSVKSHCDQAGCLMRAELEFGGGMAKMLTAKNGQAPLFCGECLLDLQSNGGK